MVVRREVYGVVDPPDDVAAVAREQARDVDMTLLKSLVRVESDEGALQLAVRGAVAAHLRAVKARAEAFELVVDLAPPGF